MVKDAERKLGGMQRPLLREMNVLMLKDTEQKPGGVACEREIRQEQDRVQYHASREIDHIQLHYRFGQPAVHQKMRAFHSAMAATRFHRWGTCLENFPNVSLISYCKPPQHVLSFVTSLPRLPSEIDVLVVRKEKYQAHQNFRVRRRVVQQALSWWCLKANQVHMNAEALEQLPEDDNLSSLMSVQPEPSTAPQGCRPSEEDPYTAHLSSSFVPNAAHQSTEQETVHQAVQD